MVKLEKLSKDFAKHCGEDAAKRCILFPKFVLQSLCVWPDNEDFAKRWIIILTIASLGVMEAAHIGYVFLNIASISKVASACTTVSTTFETMAKLTTMLYFRDELNAILRAIWHDFWPADLTICEERLKEIKFRSFYIIAIASTFLLMAYISCAQFMSFPLIENTEHLPLASWYPFQHTRSPFYEVLYIWQWFMNQVVITTLSGFDAFFNAIVMICSTQFQILQDVLENLCLGKGSKQWRYLERKLQRRIRTENQAVVVCVKQHLKMIRVCEMVEDTFAHIVFTQFVVSTLAICVSCVALIADPSLFQHMLSYCLAHLLQFFMYCSVGNELTYQSGLVAESAYNCDWELETNNVFFIKSLCMVIQRAQRPETLTVGGLMQLSFANFMGTIQLSFSFYTLLNSFVFNEILVINGPNVDEVDVQPYNLYPFVSDDMYRSYFKYRMDNDEVFRHTVTAAIVEKDVDDFTAKEEDDEDMFYCKTDEADSETDYDKSSDGTPPTFPVTSDNNDDVPGTSEAQRNHEENESFAMQLIYSTLNVALNPILEEESTLEETDLHLASREVLFDPNSQVDLLDDYAPRDAQMIDDPVLIGITLNPDEINPEDASPFPEWLIHLFEQQNDDEDENHDEPHFYCQGDGLGVHPSVIEMNDTDESSSESSVDEAQADQIASDDDVTITVGSDSRSNLEVVGHSLSFPVHDAPSALSNDSTDSDNSGNKK